MANPHPFAVLREKAGKSKCALVRYACECPVHFIVNLLQIKQEQVGKRQQRFKHAEKRFVIGERLARRVDNGVHALFLCKAKQLRHEFELEQRLAAADPRASVSLMAKKPATYYALGADFGTESDFATRLELADAGPVPSGKTGLVFPGRRIIALYGHPSGPALGVMGEQPPQEAVKRVNDLVRQYQELTPDTPTVPAFEVIATVASSSPGDDGDYSNEGTVEELRPYVEAIGKAGGFAVLDLQPGRASFLSQAQRYQELLALPYVGLALDPEWKIGPDEKPLGRVGNTTAAEVNEVSAWLADFTKTKKLPQKIFIMHQFQLQMIRNREQLNLNHPELSFVLHADGHGDAHDKMATWDKMREGLQPQIFMAWKNFIDEDTPMFDPRQTLGVQPTPWFISYQ